MKKKNVLLLLTVLAAIFSVFRAANPIKSVEASKNQALSELKPQTVRASAAAVSGKIGDFAPAAPENGQTSKKTADEKARQVPNNLPFRKQIAAAPPDAENVLADVSSIAAPMPAPAASFDGLSSRDNAAAYGFRIVPPDPFGDVGPDHYVQAVNALVRVYDKSGSALTPPFKLSSLFAPLQTPCSTRNDGDPIVLYDALADRWLISQFCNNFPPFRQLIAVSKTGDPTGEFYIYEFAMPNVKLNDYPKIGVWSDAFYMTTDQFLGSDYAGTGVFAFDRAKLLRGDASASYVYFDLATPATVRLGGLLPTDFDGIKAPPENAPNVFVGYAATEYGDAADAIRLFDFRADFANPQNSTFTERAESPLAVAAFDPTSPDGRADIAQPAPGEKLDAQSDRLMYRAAYRNFGARESIVFNQTVRASAPGAIYCAGVRVYELRKTANRFAVYEQTTLGDAGASRWMGSAAQDHQGNIAVGYSLASEEKKPSIAYAGKAASDAPGNFRGETVLIAGTGVQKAFGFRWGDYSAMSVDPRDDCTFWLTNEYYSDESADESDFGWLTRIGKFKFAECASAPRATVKGVVSNAANDQPIGGAIVTANRVYSRGTNASGAFGEFALVPDEYVLTASANGFRSQTLTVAIADGQTLTRNFRLEPVAVFERADARLTAESCAVNRSIEPGETVSLELSLRNAGARAAADLTARLLPIGGVTNPSPPQNFGAVAAAETSERRTFNLTAAPNLPCGGELVLTFALADGAENLGEISIKFYAGERRIQFRENFDAVAAPALPSDWTSSASGGQQKWTTYAEQKQSPPNAAFSAASQQIGVNELISPVFSVVSADAEIEFRQRYDLETTFLRNKLYDGAVLEIKIGAGAAWQDIETAGGSLISGGYDGVLESCCGNPLGGRRAWSGKSGVNQTPEFVTTRARLPASAAGQNAQIRFRVGTDNGTARQGLYIDDLTVSDGFACSCRNVAGNRAPFDFDGDGRTDLAVFRPSDASGAADFFVRDSSNGTARSAAWGSTGDLPASADYDGDGRTDFAVFRPSAQTWFILRSSDSIVSTVRFGAPGDRLTPADYDGDRRADISVFRPSNGFWYRLNSSNNQFVARQFGAGGDSPVPSDYDGDGVTDFAVYRASGGFWYVARSSDGGLTALQFGLSGDVAAPGDYDGDGKADFAVFRPSAGNWYFLKSRDGFAAVSFGQSGDKILQADFDGDGRADVSVFRPSSSVWYYLKSSNGGFVAETFGASGDAALPAIFVNQQ